MRIHARRVAFAGYAADRDQPISGINTTPLIDVMLVLLVMFIIIIPAQFHEIPMTLPQAGPAPADEQVVHDLAIGRGGAVTLDGAAMTDRLLAARLTALARDPRAVLHVRTDEAARYAAFAQTLATVKRAGITRLGFVGNPTRF